tara:strand:+ start:860 stop:1006 length:147 start_codon:yes stop_codon:yes gene_type:complete
MNKTIKHLWNGDFVVQDDDLQLFDDDYSDLDELTDELKEITPCFIIES